jgi:CubicO group peptidase (beta-lactamase class C family)
LFLRGGAWEGRQHVPRGWVTTAFSPWIKSDPSESTPNYGWYWWTRTFAPHWTGHLAVGWKGQRIGVFPEQNVVVTMTGLEQDPNEPLFAQIVQRYVIPAVSGRAGQPPQPDPSLRQTLHDVLEQVRTGASRIPANAEARMVPSIARKEVHHAFNP